jgi:hypothetical protein
MAAPPIPKVTFEFPNNNLGQTPPSPGNIIAVIGPCTGSAALPVNTPRTVGGSPQNVIDLAGYGPTADLAANLVQGGATVVVVRATYTPATPSAVTKVGTGASVMTVTGSPFDRYIAVRARVSRGGTVGATVPPRVAISLDGGLTETGAINVPASGVFTAIATITGMTLNFTVATMVEGDTYTFAVPYPTVAAADLATAAVALRTSTEAYSMLYFAAPLSRTNTATVVAAVGTFAAKKRFVRCFTESVDVTLGSTEAQWMAEISADFEGYASDLGVVAAGYAPCRSVALGSMLWRSIGWLAAVRASLVAISRDLGAREDNGLVPYKGGDYVTAPPASVGLPAGYFIHDEGLVPGLNADQFMTIMSEVGLVGYYITNPNIMSGPISDYNLLQFGRISDEVARLTNIYFTLRLSADILLSASGVALEKEVSKWETGNNTALSGLVDRQNVSALGTTVSRTANIINNEEIPVTVRWQPKGYPKVFAVTVAMSRTAP